MKIEKVLPMDLQMVLRMDLWTNLYMDRTTDEQRYPLIEIQGCN